MKIGILGVGFIGATLVRKLCAAGHQVLVANSRGPDTIQELADEAGATAVTAADAVKDVDVIILSDAIGFLDDVQTCLEQIHQLCTPQTRVIITNYNFLWEPVLDGRHYLKTLAQGLVEALRRDRKSVV